MPNDAKLGLVVGMSLVLVIALIFFRKEGTVQAKSDAPPAVTPKVARPVPPPPPESATTLPPPTVPVTPPPQMAPPPPVEAPSSTVPPLPPPPTGEEPASVPPLPPVPSVMNSRRPTILTVFRKAMEPLPK